MNSTISVVVFQCYDIMEKGFASAQTNGKNGSILSYVLIVLHVWLVCVHAYICDSSWLWTPEVGNCEIRSILNDVEG